MYVLDFFPYPSGDGLSVGHAKNYVPTDVLSRYYRMRGHDVLHPMGWDAFGLPAENEAIIRGRNPRDTTREYAATYRRQLQLIGCSYDWSREFTTSDPAYYRWTQWGFLLLLRRGLAYRATGRQWWCPKCRTILANEQVEAGCCWRHAGTPVERRALEQWYVRTTAYADRLLRDLDGLDWPEHITTMQRNWIGRSEGLEVKFAVAEDAVTVFTTRAETIFGVTFLALAPEHPRAVEIASPVRRREVEAYVEAALRRTEIQRMTDGMAPSGVFTGTCAAHPMTGEAIPIYVADYVLADDGGGAVMGVPGHNRRDFAFARAFDLPVRPVVIDPTGSGALPYNGEGMTTDSGEFSGLAGGEARRRIAAALQQAKAGAPTVRHRMRDWLISRQRYWGAPIPVVYCDACGVVPVPEEDLPVRLPEVERYEPSGDGRSPLAAMEEFVSTACPRCGGPARRETDTLDGFADSNWYFLRFTDPQYQAGPWSPEAVRYWLPVDWYVGGAEHAVMHLLYARFFTKVLHDDGLVEFSEPFRRLRSQGSMLSAADGTRMSKSRGNVVTPDEVVEQYGADALRVAVLFLGPFDQDVTWNPAAAAGAARFVRRLAGLFARAATFAPPNRGARGRQHDGAAEEEVRGALHRLIKSAGEAIERFRFNTLIAEVMAFLARAERWEGQWQETPLWQEMVQTLVRICAPITPFAAEEAWRSLGLRGSVHQAAWPEFDAVLAAVIRRTVVVQVDGRVRDRIAIEGDIGRNRLVDMAAARPRVRAAIGGHRIANVVVVPGKVVNFVTNSRDHGTEGPGTKEH